MRCRLHLLSRCWRRQGKIGLLTAVSGRSGLVRSALTETADDVLGRVRRYQPDWFQESMEELNLQEMASN